MLPNTTYASLRPASSSHRPPPPTMTRDPRRRRRGRLTSDSRSSSSLMSVGVPSFEGREMKHRVDRVLGLRLGLDGDDLIHRNEGAAGSMVNDVLLLLHPDGRARSPMAPGPPDPRQGSGRGSASWGEFTPVRSVAAKLSQ